MKAKQKLKIVYDRVLSSGPSSLNLLVSLFAQMKYMYSGLKTHFPILV